MWGCGWRRNKVRQTARNREVADGITAGTRSNEGVLDSQADDVSCTEFTELIDPRPAMSQFLKAPAICLEEKR